MAISFLPAVLYSTGSSSSPYGITVADLNGDGKFDLAVTNINSGDVAVLLGNGEGTFQAAIAFAAGSNPVEVVAADFDGNGRIDLAVTNTYSDNVAGLMNSSPRPQRGILLFC